MVSDVIMEADGGTQEAHMLRLRAALVGLGEIRELKKRATRGLQECNVFTTLKSPVNFKPVAPIAADPKHRSRLPLPDGPWILFKEEYQETASILDVAELLLDENLSCRKSALKHYERLGASNPSLLTPSTTQTIEEVRRGLLSSAPKSWRPAALKLYDACADDWLLCRAGFIQAIELNRDADINDYIGTLLRPSLETVSSIELKSLTAHSKREDIHREIQSIVTQAANVVEAAKLWFEELGYLPFSPEFGLVKVVSTWEEKYGQVIDLWEQLWRWGEESHSPIVVFQICQYFLNALHRIPSEQTLTFWDEVKTLLAAERGGKWYIPWLFRDRLAQHFTHYLECIAPWSDGERISHFAWWASERFASCFICDPENLAVLEKHFFIPSTVLWEFVRPQSGGTPLRFMTLRSSLWQLSLTASLSTPALSVEKHIISEEVRKVVADFATYFNITSPSIAKGQKDCLHTFGYEQGTDGVIELLRSRYPLESAGVLEALDHIRDVRTRSLHQSVDADGKLIDNLDVPLLAENVFYNRITDADIAKLLDDEERVREALLDTKLEQVHTLIEILIDIACRGPEKWRVFIAHYLATACSHSEDEERRHLLFCMTAQASTATDTMSAMRQLLSGSDKNRYRDSSKFLREMILQHMHQGSAWATGRLRPLLALL